MFVNKILAVVFLCSAFVKGSEFNSTTVTVSAYLDIFNLNFGSEEVLLTTVFFVCLELLIGVFLLFNFFNQYTKWVCLIICVFFLILTYDVASNNLLTDCGCFGSMWMIDPWTSFYKNIILVLLSILSIVFRTIKSERKHNGFIVFLLFLWIGLFCVRALLYPAMIDASFYRIGDDVSVVRYGAPIFEIDNLNNQNTPLNVIESSDIDYIDGEEIFIFFNRRMDIADIDFGIYRNAISNLNKDHSILFVTTYVSDEVAFIKSHKNLYVIDASLFNAIFPSEFGLLRLNNGVITGKMDLNMFSMKLVDLLCVDLTDILSIYTIDNQIVFWIISFLFLYFCFVLEEYKDGPLKVCNYMMNRFVKIQKQFIRKAM